MDTDRDPQLQAHFDALRAGVASMSSPPAVEQALLAAFARQHTPRPWYRRLSLPQWGMAGVGSGAVALLALLLLVQPGTHGPVQLITRDDGGTFLALEPLDRIEQEPAPRMVETELPRSALTAIGLPVSPETAGESVRAEMLVAADGAPLAVRLSTNQSP
ncbi:MAG: hypothetical protein V4463_13730 [Pseudomonadota bacterium]